MLICHQALKNKTVNMVSDVKSVVAMLQSCQLYCFNPQVANSQNVSHNMINLHLHTYLFSFRGGDVPVHLPWHIWGGERTNWQAGMGSLPLAQGSSCQLDSRPLTGASSCCKYSLFSFLGMLVNECFHFSQVFERASHYVVQAGLQLLSFIHIPIPEIISIVNSFM